MVSPCADKVKSSPYSAAENATSDGRGQNAAEKMSAARITIAFFRKFFMLVLRYNFIPLAISPLMQYFRPIAVVKIRGIPLQIYIA